MFLVNCYNCVATPEQLVQHYIVCPLPDKLDVLFSFIKTHLKYNAPRRVCKFNFESICRSKILVFFATCAQVRYAYEMFRGLQPGVPLLALHGKFKQARRTLIYFDFLKKVGACNSCNPFGNLSMACVNIRKRHACLQRTSQPEDSTFRL
jgi:ATP-dependent RNA helicase DDX10/DBP4